ncbi:MAG: four-helix bundle copper-binding protein [Armatimonadota bacterium]|nr:four-helix bundle copper-binding protein [Armatimonadota bacterium]
MNPEMSQEIQQCLQNCLDCHRLCLETAMHCLPGSGLLRGEQAEAGHIRLLLDCAEICQTSANFLLRGSDLHTLTCAVCAEICDLCAVECERVEDAAMQACAETCRRCAATCAAMAETQV